MRRFQKLYGGDFSSYQRDGHLRSPKILKVYSDDCNGNSYSRSSTPSSSGSFPKNYSSFKRGGSSFDSDVFFPKKHLKHIESSDEMGPNASQEMEFSSHDDQISDSFSNCDSLEEDKECQDVNDSEIQHDPITPEYFETCKLPLLILPKSSNDLLVENKFVMPLLGLYELLKRFHRHLRLSHFRYEDFCAAVKSPNHSPLISEVYVCLTKALIRADDSNSIVYGPHDVKDSINIFFYSLDYMSWYEIVKCYIRSGCRSEYEDVLRLLNTSSFFSNSFEAKLCLMQCLTDLFLRTDLARHEASRECCFNHEDQCRQCHKLGDLLCCEMCPAVYHLECVGLTEVPLGDWICAACKQSEVIGVSDCISVAEREGITGQVVPVGLDRHLRKYWFLCRRIFVESETEVAYYSTKDQFEMLLETLDEEYHEKCLHKALIQLQPDILKQMEITIQLTKEFKNDRHSIFDALLDSSLCFKSYPSENLQSEVFAKQAKVTNNVQPLHSETFENKTSSKTSKSGFSLPRQSGDLSIPPKTFKSLENSFTIGKEGALKVKFPIQYSRLHADHDGCCCFKLGMEGSYSSYENHYSTNSLSVSRHLYIEEKEKRRHLSYKFSIPLSGEFHWIGPTSGDEQSLVNTFKDTLLQLESCLLPCFMQRSWSSRKSKWLGNVNEKFKVQELTQLLLHLQMAIRPVLFNHMWHDALGHTGLKKTCVSDKEDSKRRECRKWKDEEEEEEIFCTEWVKYSLGVKHQLWKVKGEEFRIFGNGGWIWVSTNRRCHHSSASELGLRKIAREKLLNVVPVESVMNGCVGNCGGSSFETSIQHSCKDQPLLSCHKNLDDLSLSDNFSITNSILNGNFYFQTQKPPSKLDVLLERRLKRLTEEAELRKYFESYIREFSKDEMKQSTCMSTNNGVHLSDSSHKTQCIHNHQNLNKTSDGPEKVSCVEGCLDENVSLNFLSLASLKDMLQKGTLQMSQRVVSMIQNKFHSMNRTDLKVDLGRLDESKEFHLNHSGESGKSPSLNVLSRKHKNLFALDKSLMRNLARKEGKMEVPGFNYNCKTNNVDWPYPAPRPLFKTAWQHRTKNSQSLASLCSHLRIMWACLKWDDLMAKTPSLPIHTVTTEALIRSTEVLKKRNVLKDHEKTEYLVRELILPLADDFKIHEVYTPQRSGLRERKKASTIVLEDPTITQKWVSEDCVELWQIKYLEERLNKGRIKMKADSSIKDFPTMSISEPGSGDVQMQNCDKQNIPLESRSGAQKITIISKADGQVEIHGLQENQQVIQLPSGDIHIAISLDTESDDQNLAFVLGPKILLPRSGSIEVVEANVSEKSGLADEYPSTDIDYPSIIPHSPSSVSNQLLLQVVGQALIRTHNSDIRDRLLLMQKLIQQKLHPSSSSSSCGDDAFNRLFPNGGRFPKVSTPILNQEEREDQLRTVICGQVIRNLLDAVERKERMDSKNLKKKEMTKGKMRQIASTKLEMEMQRRKEELRRDILYKRTLVVKALKQEIKIGMVDERDNFSNISEVESESNMDERSLRSHKSSASVLSDSETSCFSPKKKKQKPEIEIPEELFCLCKTPYDNSKFYIGCDRCQNWFHGSCVSMTKPEAEKLSTYLCPNCRQTTARSAIDDVVLVDSHWVEIEKVVSNLKTHKSAWPFIRPVDPNDAPDYYSIIAEPMDLSRVVKKVQNREYKMLPDFINDVMKIFENCRYYNARNTKFYKCADILEIYFSDKLRTLRTRLKIS